MTRDLSSWLPNLIGPHTIQVDGEPIAVRRSSINFVDATQEDDPDNDATNITTGGGSGGAAFTILNADTGTIDDIASTDAGDDASGIRFSGAAPTVTGIAGGADPRTLVLIATGGTLTLKNEDSGSVAANRIITGTAGDLEIPDEYGVTLRYDTGSSRWRVLRDATAGGDGAPGGVSGSAQANDGAGGFTGFSTVLLGSGYIGLGSDPATDGGVRLSYGLSNGVAARNSSDNDNPNLISLIDGSPYGLGSDLVFVGDGGYSMLLATGIGRVLHMWSDDYKINDGNGSEILGIDGDGVQFGATTTDFGDGEGVIGIKEAVTVPTTDPTGGIVLYVEDSVLKYRQPDGTVITLDGSGGGGSSFDPATLALTAWWRANYSASPWTGTASAGSSGSNSLTEGTNPPSTGSAVNSLVPANFDGTNDKMTAGGTLDTYFSAAAYSGWALVNIDTVSTDSGFPYDNDCILTTQASAFFAIYLRSSGVVGIRHVGSPSNVSTSFSTGAWQLVQWRWNGTNIEIRVNNGSWATSAATNLTDLTSTVHIGVNYDNTQFLDGRILEIALTDTALTDADFNNVRAYVLSRYGLTV